MKFFATLLALPAVVFGVSLSFDPVYDNASGSLTTVACSDGPNGLIPRGFNTFGQLPGFPNIGGAPAVTGHGSSACGSCWQVTYSGTGNTINILAIDTGAAGFNIALEAMNTLTNGQAENLGRIDVNAIQLDPTACGLQ
jgi:hypothetical protein